MNLNSIYEWDKKSSIKKVEENDCVKKTWDTHIRGRVKTMQRKLV